LQVLICNFQFAWDSDGDGMDDNLKVPEKGDGLDEKLKELTQELGIAINESLSDSDRIAGAISEIRRAGYDVFLVLEATIGFNKREEGAEEEEGEEIEASASPRQPEMPAGKIKLTSQDQKFLRALKISIEEDHR
jgi:hypothetical protein